MCFRYNLSNVVPLRGNILGPLWFIHYVNYTTNSTSLFEIILFADDTTLFNMMPTPSN